MLPASNRGLGGNVGFPDVCLTPPLAEPIPYPNTSLNMTAATFSPNVYWTMANSLNLGTVLPTSAGDEAGKLHWTTKGPAIANTGSPIVFVNGLPARHLCNEMDSNTGNNQPCVHTIPSLTNVFLTYAPRAGIGGNGNGNGNGLIDAGEVLRFVDEFRATGDAVSGVLLADGIGHIVIRVFSSDVPALVYGAIRALGAQGMGALIVDLRDNPGGELSAFVELAGDFLDPGSTLVTLFDSDGDEAVYRARPGTPWKVPLVLLVNAGTASAAELFAGCLQSHGRATVIGETTYGKGTGQMLLPSPLGLGFECVTVARFRLPHGETIDGAGVCPDVEVPQSGSEADAQLDAALGQARRLLGSGTLT